MLKKEEVELINEIQKLMKMWQILIEIKSVKFQTY